MNTTHVIISSPEQVGFLTWGKPLSITLVGDSVQVAGLLSFRNNIHEVNFIDNTFVADRILENLPANS